MTFMLHSDSFYILAAKLIIAILGPLPLAIWTFMDLESKIKLFTRKSYTIQPLSHSSGKCQIRF